MNIKQLKKHQENINELLELIKNNQTLEIIPMVDSEVVQGNHFESWMGEWGTSKIDEFWCDDERVYFKGNDFEGLVESFIDNNYEEYKHLSDEALDRLAEDNVEGYKWQKVIVVCINNF